MKMGPQIPIILPETVFDWAAVKQARHTNMLHGIARRKICRKLGCTCLVVPNVTTSLRKTGVSKTPASVGTKVRLELVSG